MVIILTPETVLIHSFKVHVFQIVLCFGAGMYVTACTYVCDMCVIFFHESICNIYVADCTICTGLAASYMFACAVGILKFLSIMINYI